MDHFTLSKKSMLTRKFESIGCGVCAERVFAGISYSLSPGWGSFDACAAPELSRRVLEQLPRCSAVHAAHRRGGGGRSYSPPVAHSLVLRLGQNRLPCLLWELFTLSTSAVTSSVLPALMSHLLLLAPHFGGWLPGPRPVLSSS